MIKKADETEKWMKEKFLLRDILPAILMLGIIITAVVLASLSIGIDIFRCENLVFVHQKMEKKIILLSFLCCTV